MAVTIDDVRHVAALARLGVSEDRLTALAAELDTILEHMAVLGKVKTEGVLPATGVGAGGTPLRADGGKPVPLARPLDQLAPRIRHGFFLVPRLESHEEREASVDDG